MGGAILGYLIVSVAESFLHNNVQHGRARVRKFWEQHPTLMGSFSKAYFSHHIIHHSRTFRKNHVTQFRSQEEKARLDAELTGMRGALIQRERYGLSLEEFAGWQRAVDRSGMPGLRVTRIQHYRQVYERQQRY